MPSPILLSLMISLSALFQVLTSLAVDGNTSSSPTPTTIDDLLTSLSICLFVDKSGQNLHSSGIELNRIVHVQGYGAVDEVYYSRHGNPPIANLPKLPELTFGEVREGEVR